MPVSALAPAASSAFSFLREQNGARSPFGVGAEGNRANGGNNAGNNAGNSVGSTATTTNGSGAEGNVDSASTNPVSATGGPARTNNNDQSEADGNANGNNGTAEPVQLSDEELALLAELKARDQEVRQHEAAHLAVAGPLATSGPTYTYQKGPDGVNYAIGGEVGIDVSPGRTPEETIERARIVQAAALAPAEPSGQDLAVAAAAQQLEQQARAELAQQNREESESNAVSGSGSAAGVEGRTGGNRESGEANSATRNGGAVAAGRDAPEASQRAQDQREQLNRLYGIGNQANSSTSLNIFA